MHEEKGASPLLRVETKSGNSGATPTTKIKEYSDAMAFVYRDIEIEALRQARAKNHHQTEEEDYQEDREDIAFDLRGNPSASHTQSIYKGV